MYRILFFPCLIGTYLYLYLALVFNLFYSTPRAMREIWYARFGHFLLRVAGLHVRINGTDSIDLQKRGLVLLNHASILDNVVLAALFRQNKIGWNNMRTVSRISRKSIQNRVLRLFDSLLVNKNAMHDTAELKKILPKWHAAGPLQIVLYPEGTIYLPETRVTPEQSNYLIRQGVEPYRHVLFPSNGIFEMLFQQYRPDYLYDVTILYRLNGRRLVGEIDIFRNLHREGATIDVRLRRFALAKQGQDGYNWLYQLWEQKDAYLQGLLV